MGGHHGASRAPRPRALTSALGVLVASVVVLGVVQLVLVFAGPLRPRWVGSLIALVAALYLGAGVVAWLRRPSSGLGGLLTASSLVWLATGFSNTAEPWLVAVGAVTATVPLGIVVHLLIAFPSGRVRTAPERVLVVVVHLTCLVLQIPLYVFSDNPAPYDALQIADRPELLRLAGSLQSGVGMAVMLGTAVLLARRLRAADGPQRRVLAPLYAYGIVAVLATPLSVTAFAPAFGWTPLTAYLVQMAFMALVPVAFGVSIVRGGFAHTAEVEALGTWLGDGDHARTTLRRALADALGDPSVELVFWVPDRGVYVDLVGQPVSPPEDRLRRGVSEIELGGRRVGAIVYDPDVLPDPELVRRAGRVVAIAVDHDRLTAELLANQRALHLSRQRLIEAGDAARRRVERDLHDGAQQQILAVVMALRLIEARSPSVDAHVGAQVAQAASNLEAAMRELRELARGLHPALLTEIGLGGALESLAERSPIPVQLTVGSVDRLAHSTGVGAYYVVAEALTNAARHSGAEEVAVRAVVSGGLLRVEVVDHGVGGAVPVQGSGLEGLTDRVDALGGRLWIRSPHGAGTAIVAELPCA